MAKWHEDLARLGSCDEGLEFARRFKTPAQAWKACDDPEWLEWIASSMAGFGRHRAVDVDSAVSDAINAAYDRPYARTTGTYRRLCDTLRAMLPTPTATDIKQAADHNDEFWRAFDRGVRFETITTKTKPPWVSAGKRAVEYWEAKFNG